jgi:hypothetical protein
MNRWFAQVTAWGVGALVLALLPIGSAPAQEARTNGASETRVIHPALATAVAELIVPARQFMIQTQGAPAAEQSVAITIVDRSMIHGEVTLEGLRRLQQRPDRFEIRLRKARITQVPDVGDGVDLRFLLMPLTASPLEVELVLPASAAPTSGADDVLARLLAGKLRWLQVDGNATFTWTNGVKLRLRQAHATLASIPDEGFQMPRLLFVEPLHASQAAK